MRHASEAAAFLDSVLRRRDNERELLKRVTRHEQAALVMGCPDLDAYKRGGKHEEGLLILKELRGQLLDDIEENRITMAELEALARGSVAVEVAYLRHIKRLTWEQVAMRTAYSYSGARKLEPRGLLEVWQTFLADAPRTPESPWRAPFGD